MAHTVERRRKEASPLKISTKDRFPAFVVYEHQLPGRDVKLSKRYKTGEEQEQRQWFLCFLGIEGGIKGENVKRGIAHAAPSTVRLNSCNLCSLL